MPLSTLISIALLVTAAAQEECALGEQCFKETEDSHSDANVMLQSQKQVQSHVQFGPGGIEKFSFNVNPAMYENNVGITTALKDIDGNILTKGDLVAFVDDKIQGVSYSSSVIPNAPAFGDMAGKTIYDIMVHGNGADEMKPMTFAFLTETGKLMHLKAASGLPMVFKANARGCEKQADGSVKQCSHIKPVILQETYTCKKADATQAEMDAFICKHFKQFCPKGKAYQFSCGQIKGWKQCKLVPGMCDVTCAGQTGYPC